MPREHGSSRGFATSPSPHSKHDPWSPALPDGARLEWRGLTFFVVSCRLQRCPELHFQSEPPPPRGSRPPSSVCCHRPPCQDRIVQAPPGLMWLLIYWVGTSYMPVSIFCVLSSLSRALFPIAVSSPNRQAALHSLRVNTPGPAASHPFRFFFLCLASRLLRAGSFPSFAPCGLRDFPSTPAEPVLHLIHLPVSC